MKKTSLTGIVIWGMALALTGCGPMYDTQYVFSPPNSATGRTCVFQCEQNKYQCRQIEDMQNDRCEQQASYEKSRCEANLAWDKGRDPKWYECIEESCSPDYERCEAMYRSCYQACGGEVESRTVCVANCDQIPKQGDAVSSDSPAEPKPVVKKGKKR